MDSEKNQVDQQDQGPTPWTAHWQPGHDQAEQRWAPDKAVHRHRRRPQDLQIIIFIIT